MCIHFITLIKRIEPKVKQDIILLFNYILVYKLFIFYLYTFVFKIFETISTKKRIHRHNCKLQTIYNTYIIV
jgi:hypothetical protein